MEFDEYLESREALEQTASAEGQMLHPGQTLDGFKVLAFLGRGATSEIWRVHDLKQNRDYALKIFTSCPTSPAIARQRFLAEARALDEFRHPNLMRRYQLQESGDHPYFTMDILRPLSERLSGRPLRKLLEDVLSGLEALHAKGIVHRDLKPSNILLDGRGNAVLADLGVAHFEDADLAKRLNDTDNVNQTFVEGSAFIGTPRYAAPEQWLGESVTPATDIYALGIVIEQLAGDQMSFPLRHLIRRMTAAKPSSRFQNTKQIRRYLRVLRIWPMALRLVTIVVFCIAGFLFWKQTQPTWIDLPDSAVEVQKNPSRLVITLNGGHYRQSSLHLQPTLESPTSESHSASNAIERQFSKMFNNRPKRYPVYITGSGVLDCPEPTCCEIHIGCNATFITTGKFKPDGIVIKSPLPPVEANSDNQIGYPAYVVEEGGRLIFTENDRYPASLIKKVPAN